MDYGDSVTGYFQVSIGSIKQLLLAFSPDVVVHIKCDGGGGYGVLFVEKN